MNTSVADPGGRVGGLDPPVIPEVQLIGREKVQHVLLSNTFGPPFSKTPGSAPVYYDHHHHHAYLGVRRD